MEGPGVAGGVDRAQQHMGAAERRARRRLRRRPVDLGAEGELGQSFTQPRGSWTASPPRRVRSERISPMRRAGTLR